jgi:hypothetical protein
MRKSPVLLGNYIPYVEAAHSGGRQKPTALIIRTSWTTDHAGAANGIAQAWHNPRNKFASSHYVVDESTVLRCVPDKIQSGDTMTRYKGAVSIMVCHDPPKEPKPTTVSLAAQLAARLCVLYKIPTRQLDNADQMDWGMHRRKRRFGGIILETVGPFPANDFFVFVRDNAETFNRKD